MISWWEAALLGLIQGATEFLPVSSSGHLALAQRLLGLDLPGVTFEVTVHLGTLAAVVSVYRRDLSAMAVAAWTKAPGLAAGSRGRREFWADPDARWAALAVLATVPAAAAGLLFHEGITAMFHSLTAVAAAWIVTGALLLSAHIFMNAPPGVPYARRRRPRRPEGPLEDGPFRRPRRPGGPPENGASHHPRRPERYGGTRDDHGPGRPRSHPYEGDRDGLTWLRALGIGLFQAAALLPGISRSGSTISAGIGFGTDPAAAARFSFILAVPAIAGAGLLDLVRIVKAGGPSIPASSLLIGFVAAAVSGRWAIGLLLSAVVRGRLLAFAFYVWILAAAVIFLPL